MRTVAMTPEVLSHYRPEVWSETGECETANFEGLIHE
jgi:hypothetical protein